MIAELRTAAGLARSLAIYRARPWRITGLARFYSRILGPGDLAFDIGAHVGNRTRALLRAGARVVALEPQPVFHAFLARDLPPEVTLLPLAAGPAVGKARMAVSRLHPTVSSIAEHYPARVGSAPGFGAVRWDGATSVDVTTLDALIAAHGTPRFIKIDVEGFEAEVLGGLSQPVPWLAFEFLPADPDATTAALSRLGALGRYSFNLVEGEASAFDLNAWRDADGVREALAGRSRSGDVYARLDA